MNSNGLQKFPVGSSSNWRAIKKWMGDKGAQSTFSSDFDILKIVTKCNGILVKSQYHSTHVIKFAIFLNLLKI